MIELGSRTPKRKSILWDYENDGNARVVALRAEKVRELASAFKEEIPDLRVNREDGLAIMLNGTGTEIWEMCDGLTSLDEIVRALATKYRVDVDQVAPDVSDFLDFCQDTNILDLEWRSIS